MSDQHSHSAHAHGAHETQPEPQSPMWLPVVGILLFLLAAAYWALATGKPASNKAEGGIDAPSGRVLAQGGDGGFVPNARLKDFLDRKLPTH